MAYISDSPSSSVPYWVAKDARIFKKQGLDLDLIFINGSTPGIQSLIAGDLDFTKAVGAKAADLVDMRLVNELKRNGFIDKLYGKDRMGKNRCCATVGAS